MGKFPMIEFAWPYVFLLLPLPWVIYKLFPSSRFNENAALRVPELNDFNSFQHRFSSSIPKPKLIFAFFIWLIFLTSAARPQWVGERVEIPQSGRDLMLAVDLSGSMQIEDFEIKGKFTNRLTALKLIASDFIERRKGDRIGLILFGTHAYLQTPLTFDLSTVKQLLKEAAVGLAGPETAIGDAIALAVKQLRDSPQASRVLILLTDGNNNAGELTPEKAAEIASHENLKIHTVAIGAKEMHIQTFFGRRQVVNPSADIDEKALKMVAEKTGGKYFRAYNTKELAEIYQNIDQIERIERTNQYYRPTDEIYYWPLLMMLLAAALWICYEIRWAR
jgi:Ca-activated chloride channel family protein